MQNTFKIVSTENQKLNQVLLTWGEDMLLAQAANYALDLRKRYPHLTFKIQLDRQLVKSFSSWEEWENN